MRYLESLLKYANRHGVKQAMRKYNEYASYIYFWRARWEESGRNIESLRGKSKRPNSQPNQHTEEELTLICNLRRRNPDIGLIDLWHKLRARGYTRSISGLHKALARLGTPTNAKSSPSPTYKPKPYEPMAHPGERVQIDVKYVPINCIDHHLFGKNPYYKLFQYTAIDEYSRLRILGGYDEHNTYASAQFLKVVVSFYKSHGIEVKCVQTDNGAEFTKRLIAKDETDLSSFELTAKHLGIQVKHIKPHTPRHNGKVERSHREDQKLFYSRVGNSKRVFKGLDDFRKKLKRHQDKTNNRPMRPLEYKSPLEYLTERGGGDSDMCVEPTGYGFGVSL
jgi:transposase InsO family protein